MHLKVRVWQRAKCKPNYRNCALGWNRGIDSNPNDAYEFTESLLFLAENQEERKKLGESGRF